MSILASLTTTAVRRGWPPAVYLRLVSQLRDTEDSDLEEPLEVFEGLLSEMPLNPLLFEYIWLLSNERNSGLNYTKLLAKFSKDSPQTRSQHSKDLMSYLARGGTAAWKINEDSDQETKELLKSLAILVDQACSDCPESRLLVISLVESNNDLVRIIPDLWRKMHAKGFFGLDIEQEPLNPSESPNLQRVCSRSTRLLWMDWLVRTAQPFDFVSLKPQLDLLWPHDRVPVIAYELCVTAFDVLAAPQKAPVLIGPFIVKRLPLILKDLIQLEINKLMPLDGVVSRVLTTLDKEVVESVESRYSGIRADFSTACIDLGLCDPTVLHTLHRSHIPAVNPPIHQISVEVFDWAQFPQLDPVNQSKLAHELVTTARGYSDHGPMTRHALTKLCIQLCSPPIIADNVFVHASVEDFVASVCAHADAASDTPEEGGGEGSVYSDLGILLATLDFLCNRYECKLDKNSWSNKFLTRKMFTKSIDFNAEKIKLMGQWIIGLFSGSGSGIADELLRPFSELSDVLAALLQQAIRAHRSAVIDRETFRNGLDYFLQPFSVTLLGPLAARVFNNDLIEGLHQTTTIECIIYFVTMLLAKKGSQFEIAKSLIVPIMKQILINYENEVVKSVTMQRLYSALTPLVHELSQQIEPKKVKLSFRTNNSSGDCLSLTTLQSAGQVGNLSGLVASSITSLMTWQLKTQGIPTIPGRLTCIDAKNALGIERTRQLVEKTCMEKQKSPETLCAILVVDSLWTPDCQELLVNADFGDKNWSNSAKELIEKLRKVRRDREAILFHTLHKVITKNDNKKEGIQEIHDRSTNKNVKTDNDNSSKDEQVYAPLDDPMDVQFNYHFNNSTNQQDDFDGDFSQPMNLEDLDSAMDFAWD